MAPADIEQAVEQPVEEPLEEALATASEPGAGRTDPSAAEPGVDESPTDDSGSTQPELQPLELDETFLSILADPRPNDRPVVAKAAPVVVKPTAVTAQTFLQELKSFWKEDSTRSSIEMSELKLSKDFWDGLDRMSH